MIEPRIEAELTNGGDCFAHYHSSDRVRTHDDVLRLQELLYEHSVSGTYAVTEQDDILLCATGGTLTLPLAKTGREFIVVMTGTTNVTVSLTGSDLLYGASSILLNAQGMALHFKAVAGGWVLI